MFVKNQWGMFNSGKSERTEQKIPVSFGIRVEEMHHGTTFAHQVAFNSTVITLHPRTLWDACTKQAESN